MKKVKSKAKKIFSNLFSNIKSSPIFYIVLMSVFIMAPLITTHGYFYGHDTAFHAQSIADMEQTDFFDTFNVHIMSDTNHGVGYGAGIFYPQLSHQVAVLFFRVIKPLGGSVYTAMKITHFLGIFLSGITIYVLMKRITKNKTVSVLTAFCYMTFPYHVGDILIRDAFSESYFFIFLPLVFLGLHELLNKKYHRFLIYFCIGYIGLINSHLALAFYLTIFLFIISLFFFKQVYNLKTIKYLLISFVVVGAIVSPFIIGIAQNMLSGTKYVFSTSGMMLNSPAVVNGSRLNLADYIIPEIKAGDKEAYKNVPSWLNILAAILAALTIINYKKIVNKDNKFIIKSSIIAVFLCIFLSTEFMHWSIVPQIFRNIQFPWRLNTILVFAISILAGFSLIYYKVNKDYALMLLFIMSCLLSANSVQRIQTYGQSFGISDYSYKDYYPAVMYDATDDEVAARSDLGAIVINGYADIGDYQNHKRDGVSFNVSNISSCVTTIEIPRLYYVGYTIIGKTSDGASEKISYHMSDDGYIAFDIDKSYTDISVTYTNTVIGNISRVISGIGLTIFCGYIIYYSFKDKIHAII